MNEDFRSQHEQLIYDTQLSLHRYHKAITSLLIAVENRSSIVKPPNSESKAVPNYIKDSLSDIQSIQLKKLRLFYNENSSYMEQKNIQPMLKERRDFEKPKAITNKQSKIPVKTSKVEPQKNMVSFKINLSGEGNETSAIEGKPMPPWRPNS